MHLAAALAPIADLPDKKLTRGGVDIPNNLPKLPSLLLKFTDIYIYIRERERERERERDDKYINIFQFVDGESYGIITYLCGDCLPYCALI